MQPHANAKPDRTPEVDATISHTVPWRVKSVTATGAARLRVTFIDGTSGDVNMQKLLESPTTDDTEFEALRDAALFAQVRVTLGAIEWPNGADLAPDAMYDAIRQHGVWELE